MIRLNDIKVSIDYTTEEIKSAIAKKLNIKSTNISSFEIVRRSIDARYNNVRFSLGVQADIKGLEENISELFVSNPFDFPRKENKSNDRPVIIGAGPAGMFAALVLAEAGYFPILIERGQSIQQRKKQIEHFQKTGELDTESNVCFGEGGAGTFSDGKLNSRVNDALCTYVLKTFVKNGADRDIMINAKPHIGTDLLSEILIKIREQIIFLGGEVSFNEKMTDIIVDNENIKAVITSKRKILCSNAILATGHGARDVYKMLNNRKIVLESKGFALGVRIEHHREMIDKALYGKYSGNLRLGAASYNLKGRFADRNVYTFCMCPGGEVINASTESDGLCVNGMSYNSRDGINSNAAVVVQMNPADWGSDPMKGIEFQRKFEQLAFDHAGGNFSAPVQRFEDFDKGIVSKKVGDIKPSIKGNISFVNIPDILGDDISSGIKYGIKYWDRIIEGYSSADAMLTGIEGRTSSPVRILRGANMQSAAVKGLYPCGEGAGYAGGIMSAAIDGIKCAINIMHE